MQELLAWPWFHALRKLMATGYFTHSNILRSIYIPLDMCQVYGAYRTIAVFTEPWVSTTFGGLLERRLQAIKVIGFVALITSEK